MPKYVPPSVSPGAAGRPVCRVSSNHIRSLSSGIPWIFKSTWSWLTCALDSFCGATTGCLWDRTRPSTHSSNLMRSVPEKETGVPELALATAALDSASTSVRTVPKKRFNILPASSRWASSTASKFGTSSMFHMVCVDAASRPAFILSERTRFTPFVLYSAPSHSLTVTMLRAQPGPNKYCAPAQTKTEHATQLRRVSFLFRPRQCPFRDSLSIPPRNSSLSLGGRAPRSPPSLMLTPLLVWVHPLCGHCHAGARQRSSVMVSLRSSLSLLKSCIAIA